MTDRLSPAALRLLDLMSSRIVTAADVAVCRRTARQLILRHLLRPSPLARVLRLREGTAALGFQPVPLVGLVWDGKLYWPSRRCRAILSRLRGAPVGYDGSSIDLGGTDDAA